MGVVPFSLSTGTGATGTVSTDAPLRRVAIIGTAPSWKQCPWQDKTLECWSLNDAYLLGIPRADRWYDLHPFHQMNFRPTGQRTVTPDEAPPGTYLRPEGHLDWLRSRPFPVYLAQARADWPNSRLFPQAEVLQWFADKWPLRLRRDGTVEPGPDYEVSTPSWMLMQAMVEGYQEISVFGIHLATDWERQAQRHNFEWLLGFAGGRGIKIVLPYNTPICKSSYRYAYEPKADLPLQAIQRAIERTKTEGLKLRQTHARLPWYARRRKQDAEARLKALDVELLDQRQSYGRAQTILHVG